MGKCGKCGRANKALRNALANVPQLDTQKAVDTQPKVIRGAPFASVRIPPFVLKKLNK